MLRLIGMLIGSALAIAILIVALGVPRLTAPAATPEAEAMTAAIPEAVPAAPAADVVDTEPAAPEPEPEPEPAPETLAEADVAALVDQVFAPEKSGEVATAAAPEPVTEIVTEPVNDEQWYAFWSPFRSELAANGFVARLQASTGIDYRVVKVKTGVYEVAFAYSDEADIQAKLARIADATGLDMTGG